MTRHPVSSFLFGDHPELGAPERRRAALISCVTFVYTVLFVISTVVTAIAAPTMVANAVTMVLAPAGVAMFTAYAVARKWRAAVGLWLALAIIIIVPIAIMVLMGEHGRANPFETAAWELPAIMVAGTLGDLRTAVATCVGTLLAIAVGFALGHAGWVGPLAEGAMFVLTTGALSLVLAVHRNRIELDRSAELRNTIEQRTAELRQNQKSMVLAEKMASLGRFTAGIAHEMNSPLAAASASVVTALELVDEYTDSIGDPSVDEGDHRAIAEELRSSLLVANAASARLQTFVRSIRAQTRGASDRRRTRFDIAVAVNDALTLLGHAVVRSRCRLSFRNSIESPELDGDPGTVAQIVTNLVSNAIDATGDGGGEIEVALERQGAAYCLSVSDNGHGIPADTLGRIFEPLFTTKPVGKGTGLGLTIVHDLVHAELSGSIEAANRPGGGAVFTVTMPVGKAA
jgi:signal transduction histidine kinase